MSPPQIPSPLRILVLSTPSTPLPLLLQESTLPLSTPYYEAQIPIWHDTIHSSAHELSEWEEEWRGEEAAGEVVKAVGAWVVVVRKPIPVRKGEEGGGLAPIRHILTTISSLIAHHTSSSASYLLNADPPLLLAVGMHQPLSPSLEVSEEEWEDLGQECGGWEWIDGEREGGGRNEFGEKQGLPRLLEALQTNDWTAATLSPSSSSSTLSLSLNPNPPLSAHDPETETETELSSTTTNITTTIALGSTEPLLGSRLEYHHPDDDEEEGEGDEEEEEKEEEDTKVENLESLMTKMLAIKDLTATLPSAAERQRFAARAVDQIMRSEF